MNVVNGKSQNITFNSVSVESCSSKFFRDTLISNLFVPPRCEKYWERKFPNLNFNWSNIWLAIPSCTKEPRLLSLNWKILHNIYPTKVLLYKMGKEPNNVCTTCNVIDYPEHFFFDCIKSKQLWYLANKIIAEKTEKQIKLSAENVIFNFNHTIHDVDSKFINYVIAVGKMCISKFRYGDHPCLLFLFERELRLRGLIACDR